MLADRDSCTTEHSRRLSSFEAKVSQLQADTVNSSGGSTLSGRFFCCSKLRLLSNALSGNSRTSMIGTLSPAVTRQNIGRAEKRDGGTSGLFFSRQPTSRRVTTRSGTLVVKSSSYSELGSKPDPSCCGSVGEVCVDSEDHQGASQSSTSGGQGLKTAFIYLCSIFSQMTAFLPDGMVFLLGHGKMLEIAY